MTRHSLRDDATTDYRTTNAGAWRRGHESAAICEGDDTQGNAGNPYREYSDNWCAFLTGWSAWVLDVLSQRDGISGGG